MRSTPVFLDLDQRRYLVLSCIAEQLFGIRIEYRIRIIDWSSKNTQASKCNRGEVRAMNRITALSVGLIAITLGGRALAADLTA